jgi:hypothetical protein
MFKRTTRLSLVGYLAIGAAFAQGNSNGNASDKAVHETLPHSQAGGGASSTPISYHGGQVLVNGVNAYYIWYGNWSGNTAKSFSNGSPGILPVLTSSIGGSAYFNVNTTYYNGSGVHVLNSVSLAGQTDDNYSRGAALSDGDIQAIVSAAINRSALPADPKGVYFVLTSADVNETSGFCTQYCGWHTHGNVGGTDIKYAFIGNPDRCPTSCEAQTASSPNHNPGADGMASIIAHELEEATTDPDLNAWYDKRGYENADKCAWTFGTTYLTGNGAHANMNLGGLDYLIQQNWVNANGGYCALKY